MDVRFAAGQFYGVTDLRAICGCFEIASLRATGREEDVEPHTHQRAHFVLVLAGAYISSARGAPILACPPFLVFNPAGTHHRDRFLAGVGRFLAVTPAEEADPAPEATRITDPRRVRAAWRIERSLREPGHGPLDIECAAWELVEDEERSGALPSWLGRAYERIMDGDEPPDVRELAACAGIHPVHLARVFQAWFGCSPGELLRRRRLERAAEMLARGKEEIAEIAAAVGFADQSHLTHAFRNSFGLTPARFKRRSHVARLQYSLQPSRR